MRRSPVASRSTASRSGEIDDAHFRADVGLVPQEPFLLAASARENIDMGRGLLGATIVEAAARAAHAHDFIERLEQGYDTPLGEGGARLSSGQKQLIADRARAGRQAARPVPRRGDVAHRQRDRAGRAGGARPSCRGKTTVIAIAHRLSTIRAADRIVVLNHGRIAERARTTTLMAIDGGDLPAAVSAAADRRN